MFLFAVLSREIESMNLVVFDVDGTLIQSTGVDDECFARAVEVAWGIPSISTQWNDYEHVTDTVLAKVLLDDCYFAVLDRSGKSDQPNDVGPGATDVATVEFDPQ